MIKRRRQRHPAAPKTAPVTVTITDLSRSGAGVGRDSKGRALFVPLSAPGDVVKVKLQKIKRRYAEGELLELIEASPLRVTPRCPVFGRCGGCQWQHIPYDYQWQTKEAGVRESMRLAKIAAPAHWQGFPAQHPWEYRNRVQLRGQGSEIGFHARLSNKRVPIQRCDIVHPAINAVLGDIVKQGSTLNEPYKVELYLAADGSVQQIWNEQHGAAGFRQVNDEQNGRLQAWIRESFTPVAGLLDLYGGSGNLSLPLAGLAGEVHCVDLNSPKAGMVHTPGNFHFHRSPVLAWLQQRLADIRHNKLVLAQQVWTALIDPPRGGLADEAEAVIAALEGHNVQTAVLVGCKTDPWSRDVTHFIDRGWQLDKVAVFDFFPQTSHVESVAWLTRSP